MLNDTENITLDHDLELILIDGDPIVDIYRDQAIERIRDYIEWNEIAKVGSTIVASNAQAKISPPSSEGTMLNLYNLMYACIHFKWEN